ncbi:CAP domain-containing protein [Nannocystis pusilla]|uniref:CAP domain-containing protein n=1 Tax=Nannocystis pusilla TaxID=889268 RepID=A0ABS7TKB9_9BACT|nr:CAP domain-containing protein [Nannocystis pusilla]MBZ5708572.1 CAP domain-containing protein [Nannocystis pusilla]
MCTGHTSAYRAAARRALGSLGAAILMITAAVQATMSVKTDAAAATPAAELEPRADSEPGRLAGITGAHNSVRAALGIPGLTWSPAVAQFAQAWADELEAQGCVMKHRPDDGPDAQQYGENIFKSWGYPPRAEDVVAKWVAEEADYDDETNTCSGVCGHYTQVVWRDSRRLGCGMAVCGDQEVWICNYDPPGNITGEWPY